MRKLRVAVLMLTALFAFAGCQRAVGSRSQIRSHSPNQAHERVSALHALQHLAVASHLYAQQHDGVLPDEMSELEPFNQKSFGLAQYIQLDDYALVASGKLSEIDDTAHAILIRKKDPFPDGRQAVAYVDGRTDIVPMMAPGQTTETVQATEMASAAEPAPTRRTRHASRPASSERPKWHFSLHATERAAADEPLPAQKPAPDKRRVPVKKQVSPKEQAATKKPRSDPRPSAAQKPKWHFSF